MSQQTNSPSDAAEAPDAIAPQELQWRVVYSLLRPAVRLASSFELSLRDLKEWLGVSYLHELKRRGLTQNESADRIGVSRRTIISLSRKLRENFFEPERHEGAQRRILFMLWAEAMSAGRLKQSLGGEFEEDEIEDALATLVEQGSIRREERQGTAHYELERGEFRLYKDNWIARIDALNNQLDHISDTVFARFFTQDRSSFVRTITLSVREQDLSELERLYREVIFPELVRLDEAAAGQKDVQPMEISISWAPKDFISTTENSFGDGRSKGESP
jgi:transcriptional regulator with XRE-family HTH domain